MAILGTITQSMIDNSVNRGVKYYVNGVFFKDGLTYSTGDIISFRTDSNREILDNLQIVGSSDVEYLTTETLFKTSEVKLTGTTPFILDFSVNLVSIDKSISPDNRKIQYAIDKNVSILFDDVEIFYMGIHYDGVKISLKANDGYVITMARLFINDGHTHNRDFTISSDGKTAFVHSPAFGISTRFLELETEQGEVEPPKPDMVVTQDDLDSFINQNGTLKIGSYINDDAAVGDIYKKNSVIRYIVNKDFYDVQSVTLNDGNVSFSRFGSDNDFYLPYPYEYSDGGLSVTVIGDDVFFYVKQDDIDYVNSQNSKLYVNNVLADSNTRLNVGDEIKVVANNGYKYFDNEGYSSVYSSNANTWLELSNDETSAKFTINNIARALGFDIETVVVQQEEVAGVNNVYSLTYEQVKEIISMDLVDDTLPSEPKQIGNLLLGLLELPFDLPQSMFSGSQNVSLGGYSLPIVADVLKDDVLTVNFGDIVVPNIKNNLLDFKNTTTVLNMPYVDRMVLDTDDVIGQTISVQMVVNLYDSMATVNVSSSKSNKIVLSKSVDLKLSIPFGDVASYPKGNNPQDVYLKKDNGIKTAFIEVISNETLNENGLFTIPIIDENLVGLQTGYIEVENIDLKSSANREEKDRIISLLNRGVIIND